MHLRVMTYNIHKGIGGLDRKYRLERVVEVIAHYEPHAALLQEVDDGVPRSHRDCQVEKLAEALRFEHTAFQQNVTLRRGAYGNAILSRFPITGDVDIDLTIGPKKRRQAQAARLVLENDGKRRTATIVNLHLGLAGFERGMQLRRLFAQPELAKTADDEPVLVGGDFNDVWRTLGKRYFAPQGFQLATGHTRTFPAAAPVRPLDTIYFRGAGLSCTHHFAGKTRLARQASDHRPLLADFELE